MRVTMRQRLHLFLVQSKNQNETTFVFSPKQYTTKYNETKWQSKWDKAQVFFFFSTKQIYTKKTNYKGKALNMNENEESKAIHIKNKDKGECFLTHASKWT